MKTRLMLAVSVFLAVIFAVTAVKSETITMRTWYPSPYGSYQRLKASDFLSANKVVFEPKEEAPVSPSTGTVYYDTALTCLRVYTENGWVNLGKDNYLAVVNLPATSVDLALANGGKMPVELNKSLSDPDIASASNGYVYLNTKSDYGKADYKIRMFGKAKIKGQGSAYVYFTVKAGTSSNYSTIMTTPKYKDSDTTFTITNPNSSELTDALGEMPAKCFGVTAVAAKGASFTYKKRLSNKSTTEVFQIAYTTDTSKYYPTYMLNRNADRSGWRFGVIYNSYAKNTAVAPTGGWQDVNGPGTSDGPIFSDETEEGADTDDKPIKAKYTEAIKLSADQLEDCDTVIDFGPMEGIYARGQKNFQVYVLISKSSTIEVKPQEFDMRVSVQ